MTNPSLKVAIHFSQVICGKQSGKKLTVLGSVHKRGESALQNGEYYLLSDLASQV